MKKRIRKRLEALFEKYFEPIPSVLYSVEHEAPFEKCAQCCIALIQQDLYYLIEKVWHEQEVIAEYALCEHCVKGLSREYSKESRKHISRHMRKHRKSPKGFDACRCCGIPREELDLYNMVAECIGDSMFTFHHPTLICHPCVESLMQGLSAQTRDRMDRFEQEILPGPPADTAPLPTEVFTLV